MQRNNSSAAFHVKSKVCHGYYLSFCSISLTSLPLIPSRPLPFSSQLLCQFISQSSFSPFSSLSRWLVLTSMVSAGDRALPDRPAVCSRLHFQGTSTPSHQMPWSASRSPTYTANASSVVRHRSPVTQGLRNARHQHLGQTEAVASTVASSRCVVIQTGALTTRYLASAVATYHVGWVPDRVGVSHPVRMDNVDRVPDAAQRFVVRNSFC